MKSEMREVAFGKLLFEDSYKERFLKGITLNDILLLFISSIFFIVFFRIEYAITLIAFLGIYYLILYLSLNVNLYEHSSFKIYDRGILRTAPKKFISWAEIDKIEIIHTKFYGLDSRRGVDLRLIGTGIEFAYIASNLHKRERQKLKKIINSAAKEKISVDIKNKIL
ncbi:MAG: hypothetical protein KKD39_07635 [Candidatus Altiarchaeota archaeon]|nr:hypothetical protein [Candidatus Altiarchaeota archaeon]